MSDLESINHAASLLSGGKLQEAERLCLDILKRKTDDFNASLLLGIVKSQQNDHSGALACFDQALRTTPRSYEALYNRGVTLQRLQRHQDAIDSYDEALSVKSDCFESLNNRGNALQDLQRHVEAIESYDRALTLKPDYAEAHSNRGNALRALKRHTEAIASCDKALSLKPDHVEILRNRGANLHALHRYSEALRDYDKALSLEPDCAEALSNRGATLQALKRHSEAMRSYEKALSLKPDYADALWNKGLLLLLMGEFDQGWTLYEWRWKRSDAPPEAVFTQPLWLGNEDISGKRLLLHAEQGLGDAIQFSRYVKAVAARGATVVLQVPKPLTTLLRNIEGAAEVISMGDPLPQYDLHSPLMRLPLAFKTSLETIPSTTPYLKPDAGSVAKWTARLGPADRLRVGLAWSGGTLLANDHNRSIPLQRLSPLFQLPVDWICLQKEIRDPDRAELARIRGLRHFDETIDDFSDTAALTALCDVVISVDTAVAHLAGALGRRLWLLVPFSPDWRWLIDREDSPWYPTAKLFRQPALGDWDSPIEHVKRAIELLC